MNADSAKKLTSLKVGNFRPSKKVKYINSNTKLAKNDVLCFPLKFVQKLFFIRNRMGVSSIKNFFQGRGWVGLL